MARCFGSNTRQTAFAFQPSEADEAAKAVYPIGHHHGLMKSSLGLIFRVSRRHFDRNGVMKLKCTVTVSESYSLSSEKIVVGTDTKLYQKVITLRVKRSTVKSPRKRINQGYGHLYNLCNLPLVSVHEYSYIYQEAFSVFRFVPYKFTFRRRRMLSGGIIESELPDDGPVIYGGQTHYHVGDTMNVTCTYTRQGKPVTLSWLLNDEEVPHKYLVHYLPEKLDLGTYQTALGLHFKGCPPVFENVGDLTFKRWSFR
ncbi:hypothetical protein BIW11_05000 [Tropilaelaps mercedesae]|uniref:Ig-like domain-containing protein n=1 Tax=Tropilaelaps mercedesae TaxID=418985 RepID=A0A1V9WYZ1_9ACAR|nr:hypothetical protein BIW11_05000 [Tropilaelaps mercedesae]